MPIFQILSAQLAADIKNFQVKGAKLVKVAQTAEPKFIVETINDYIRDLKSEGKSLDQEKIIALGTLVGEQYVRSFNWHWREVTWPEEAGYDGQPLTQHCVLPQDNSLYIDPISWIFDIVARGESTTILLNYNMVEANKLPAAQPNQALRIH